jgi:poly [ADP-ribose] polymerase
MSNQRIQLNLANYTHDKYRNLIDIACPDKFKSLAHIHIIDGFLLTCSLNQTDIETNSNKYVIIQLLKNDKTSAFFLIWRSGRTGSENTRGIKCFLDETQAVNAFNTMFFDKTGTTWEQRGQDSIAGKYGYVEMMIDHETEAYIRGDANANANDNSSNIISALDAKVSMLVDMIFDLQIFEEVMAQFKIDTSKAPLGKISQIQINKAYAILSQIQQQIKETETENENETEKTKKFTQLSSAFYTLIPTSNGNQRLPVLSTTEDIQTKSDLLDSISNMTHLSNNSFNMNSDTANLMPKYLSLKCEIKPLIDPNRTRLIHDYFNNTKGATHSHRKFKIGEIYEINREGEAERFQSVSSTIGNRQLLFHGSRLTNISGILSKGILIAPPEAPISGYMFGKGIYTANSCTKSLGYMHTNANRQGIMLLCEIALGKCCIRKQSHHVNDLPNQHYQSTWGLGRQTTDGSEKKTIDDGLTVPMGRLIPSNFSGVSLEYDEFIVYDIRQCRIRYAVMIELA